MGNLHHDAERYICTREQEPTTHLMTHGTRMGTAAQKGTSMRGTQYAGYSSLQWGPGKRGR